MHVCLVKPPTCTSVLSTGADATPPLGLAYLTSSLKAAGHEVSCVDGVGLGLSRYARCPEDDMLLVHGLTPSEIIERMPDEVPLIGISTMFSMEWLNYRRVINTIRRAYPDATIVIGGEHATALPEHSLRDCPAIDFIALGEGEETMCDLATQLEAGATREELLASCPGIAGLVDGEYVAAPRRKRIRAVDDIPEPDWSLIPIESYIAGGYTHGVDLGGRTMPIMASRGCPFECTFCSSPNMWTTRWKARDPQKVLDEIRRYVEQYNATNFDFYDLTAIVNKKWTIEFARLVRDSDLEITWQLPTGTRSEALDAEVMEALYASGCKHVIYAPESGNERVLKMIKKKVKIPRMIESMRAGLAAGMRIKANLIIGFPGETKSDLFATWRFAMKMAWIGIEDVSVFPYVAYPGTALFDGLVESGRITLDEDYFHRLMGFANPAQCESYCDDMSTPFLRVTSLAMMASYYALSLGMRPWRAFKIVLHLLRGQPTSRLEMSLDHIFTKLRQVKSAPPPSLAELDPAAVQAQPA